MVVLTLIIGTLNIGLGFALAVYLGYGPPSLRCVWDTPLVAIPRRRRVVVAEESDEEPDEELDEIAEKFTSDCLTDLLEMDEEDDLGADMEVEDYEDPEEEALAEHIDPNRPEIWDLNEKYVETAVLKLNIAMMKSGVRATEIDTSLRQLQGKTTKESIEGYHKQLVEDCEVYLAEQAELAEKFRTRIGEMGELSDLGEEIEMANLEQAAQVETTLSNLKHMDFESDLEAANIRLLEEIGNLRYARHKLRDNQDMAFVAIARYEGRLGKVEKQLYDDPLTRHRNRIGTEATLHQWWQQGRHKSRQMSVVLFDLDKFTEVNEKVGPQVGDQIISQIAQLIDNERGQSDLLGRFSGQQFLWVMFDVGPRTAAKNAETMRQALERTTFLSGKPKEKISLTTCVGVAEVTPEISLEDTLNRVQACVKAAKKHGPNTGCFYEKDGPELIESPNFGAEHREIALL